jgi:NADPH-dependent curcumin reductase CurA
MHFEAAMSTLKIGGRVAVSIVYISTYVHYHIVSEPSRLVCLSRACLGNNQHQRSDPEPAGWLQVCGTISNYNDGRPAPASIHISNMIYAGQRIEGFVCTPWLSGAQVRIHNS